MILLNSQSLANTKVIALRCLSNKFIGETMILSQQEAQRLFELPKKTFSAYSINFPPEGEKLTLECFSEEKRYIFQADIDRSGLIKPKLKFQNRYNKVFVLRRLEIIGPPHKNPPDALEFDYLKKYENMEIPCPHLHIYIEGFNDKWAIPVSDLNDLSILTGDTPYEVMTKFFKYCNIEIPKFEITLFS